MCFHVLVGNFFVCFQTPCYVGFEVLNGGGAKTHVLQVLPPSWAHVTTVHIRKQLFDFLDGGVDVLQLFHRVFFHVSL